MDIFQKSITPDKPRVLAEEQIYVYVPMATSTNAGIASYNRDQFDIIGSEVSLKWPAESFTQGPIETPSIVKVLDNEFEYTGNLVDLISGNSKISSDKLEVQLKRILRDAYERPELVMLDPNYFVRTIVEKDGKQYYKYNTTAVHYNMSQNLSEDEQAQARQNISASSISDNDATNKRIDALLQTGVYSINGKTGNVILTTSDIENNSDYTTNSYVNEQVNMLKNTKADLDYVNEQVQLINSDKADVTYVNEQVQLINSDKATIDFVNSSIATNTATFRGTYNSLAELEAYTGEKDNNDYAFVIEIDAAGNTLYNRYKYVDNKWTFEYTLNNSSFTEAQWAAINSGITDNIIETIRTNITNLQNDKVSKVDGKGLSTNDFTDNYKLQVENNTAARHIHNNKTLLDTYTQTEVNLADAVNKKHAHNNKTLLDTYTQTEANLADAVNKKHIHDNKEILDGITASYTTEEKAKLNGIANGAEVNVQADWEQTDSSSKDYIKNKPLIPEGVKLYSSTGENTDGAMTQKAVTDEFKNNVSILFAESERQKSKNLFNKDAVLKNHEINGNNGTIVASADYWVSDYIRVIGMSSVYISSTKTSGSSNVFYDNNYNILSISSKTNGVLSIPSNAVYIRCNGLMSELENDIQIEEGSVATDYQPYRGQITHNGDAPVVFAELERQKSKNLFNSARVPINSDSLEYNVETNTFIYTITETIESSGTGFVILKYGKLKPGTYTMSFNTTSTIGNTAPVIVAKLNEYDNFSSSIATKNIIDGYVYLTFTLTEETNIGLAWYYKAGWIAGDAPSGVKTLTNLQLEEGSVATEYQPYNGAIVHDKQLTEQLSNYLPLSGGKMTGRISFADGNVALPETDDLQFITGIESYAAGGGITYTHRDKLKQKLLQTNGAIIKGRAYNSGDDEGLIIEKADNGFAGLCLGSPTGTRSVHYLTFDNSAVWRWSNGSSSYDISHPQKAGTIALTSDISVGDNFTTYTVIDATALDENTWYPVTFDASRKNLKIMLFNQWNGGNPSWATHSTKNYGCVKIWETTGHGWGELGTYRKVYLSVFTYTNTDPVRGIGQLGNSSTEYVYVRGGGKYNFYTSHNVVPVLRTSTYTVASQSIAPTTTAPAEIVQTIMTTDDAQTISGSKTFTSDIALTKATPLINITNTGTSGDTSIRVTRSDTGNSCYFGIGAGGVNRGFYDLTQNRWIMYCDGSKSILNSATVPSGQTLTIAGSINLIV